VTDGTLRGRLRAHPEHRFKTLFSKGDRVRIKHSKMLGKICSVDPENPLGAFVYPFKKEASYSVSFDDGNDGLRFDFGESMLERESPLEPENPLETLPRASREDLP
jgi:hypothetical protein